MESSSGLVSVNGFELHYRSFGVSRRGTVIGLHGGPGGTCDYLSPVADLAQFGYRVVLYDQLGCGSSDKPKSAEHYTIDRFADDVEGVRKTLRLGRASLLGSSFGGALALASALKCPRSYRSLVIANGFSSTALLESEWNLHTPKKVRKTLEYYGAKGDTENPKCVAAQSYLDRTQMCRLRVLPYDWSYTMERFSLDVNKKLKKSLAGWDVTERLPEIRLPALVVTGEYDMIPPKLARVIHRGIRGSKLVNFRNCSHLPMWEDRVAFIETVRDFLDGVPAHFK